MESEPHSDSELEWESESGNLNWIMSQICSWSQSQNRIGVGAGGRIRTGVEVGVRQRIGVGSVVRQIIGVGAGVGPGVTRTTGVKVKSDTRLKILSSRGFV